MSGTNHNGAKLAVPIKAPPAHKAKTTQNTPKTHDVIEGKEGHFKQKKTVVETLRGTEKEIGLQIATDDVTPTRFY